MQINDAYDYLIHLIACAVHDEVPESLPDGVTYEQVLSCAVDHDVAGFAYLGILNAGQKPDNETLDRWKQRYLIGIQRNAEQETARQTLLDALHAEGIATLELQGTKVKQHYPSPDLRMMADIDIIIPKEKIPASEQVLKALGYRTVCQGNSEADGYTGSIDIELHSTFFPKGQTYSEILGDPFEGAVIEDDLTASVSDTVFWCFHLLHCLKHYHGSGVGLRRVLDLYFLKDKMAETADAGYVNRLLSEAGAAEDVKDLFAIADYWFDGKETDRDIACVIAAVKFAGTQGNLSIRMKNKIKRKHFIKLRYFLSLVFPPKDGIYLAYPYCRDRHYPYLLAWLYRAVRLLFQRGKLKKLFRDIKRIIKTDMNMK